MPNRSLFPTAQADLNDHLGVIVPYMLATANVTRLGISTANATTLKTLYSNPNVPPNTLPDHLGWVELWILHTNHNTNTHTIVTLVNAMRTAIEKQIRTIYKDIPNSALTATDRSTLRLPEHGLQHTKIQVMEYAPKGSIDDNKHLQQVLRITDPQNTTTQAMPH